LRLAKVIDTGSVSLQSGQVNRDIPTRTAASRRYFYRIPEREGVPPNWMEGFFSRVEGHAAPLLKRLIAGDLQLTDPERATLSFFFAIQMQRTPVAASQIRGVANAVFQAWAGTRFTNKELFAADYREVFGDASEEEIEEFREKVARDVREGRVEVTDPGGAAFGQGLLVAPYQSWIIFEADWTVMVCANAFVTSDRGFAIHDPAPPFPWTTQSLLSSPLSETTLPLDKSTCLMIRIGAGRIVLADVSHQEAMAQNLRLYGWADEYIFGQSQEVVVKVRQAAKATPAAVIRQKPLHHVVLLDPDPEDDSLERENQQRGRPPRLLYEGVEHDYVVVPHDKGAKIHARVDALVEKRARKVLGVGDEVSLPGGLRAKSIHPADVR
jgi:hypothetical protein